MSGIVVSVESDYRFGEIIDLLEDAEQDASEFKVLSVTDARDLDVEYDFVLELSGPNEEDIIETLLDSVPVLSYTVEREFDE